jgi:hypothetical protein
MATDFRLEDRDDLLCQKTIKNPNKNGVFRVKNRVE